jgi:PAS domain S-box-containing protein
MKPTEPEDPRSGGELKLKRALRRAEARRRQLEAVIEQMNEAVVACDRQGRLILANSAARDIYGLGLLGATIEELMGESRLSLPDGTPHPPERFPLRRALEQQEVVSGHLLHIRRRDGSQAVVRVHASPLYDVDGAQIGAVAVAPVVTEELQREAEIEAERQKLSAVIAHLDVGVSFFSPGAPTHLLLTNRCGLEILGFSSIEELCRRIEQSRPATNLRNLDGRPLPFELWPGPRAARGETFSGLEYLWERGDGHLVRLAIAGCGIRNARHQVVLGITVYRDVTEERGRERALAEAEGQLRALFEALPVGVIIANDAACRSMTLTGATARILGIELTHAAPEEVLARAPILAGPGQIAERVSLEELPLQRAIREDRRVEGEELWHRTASGRDICLLVNAAPIHDERGRITGGVAVFQDITERKLLVEHLVEANRMKDQFLAMLSHELRTPLTPVLGWTNILRKGGTHAPEAIREAATVIERNVRVQAQLIDDLLDMSRIANKKITLKLETLEVREVVRAALETIEPQARAKEIELETELDALPAAVHADATRLQQIIWNLLANAIKFTPPGGRITVSVVTRTSVAEIVVADTGIGIRPEFLPYVFDLFRQGEGEARRRTHGGLGLGLAIARSLVELHGGTIRAESEGEGRGSRFIVRLPLAVSASRAEGETEPPADQWPELAAKVRVMVVDDSRDTLIVTRIILEQEGYEVMTAETGQAALQALERSRPDVLLLDLGLSDMTGHELLRQARQLSHLQHTPAIALTGYGRLEDQQHSLEAGFLRHLVKPLDYDQLVILIREISARKPGARNPGPGV